MKWREPAILVIVLVFSTLLVWLSVGMSKIYRNYDGPFYVAVAKTWYNKEALRTRYSFNLPLEYYPAHLPLYPALISATALTGLNHLQAMVGVNLISAIGLALAVYLIAKKSGWKNPFWISLFTMFFWPRMWAVRSVGSPETLFILSLVSSLYFFERKKYWWSTLAACAAILTKSPGVLLMLTYTVLAVWQTFETKKINWKLWPLKLTGLTLLGLFYFYYLHTGDFWAYFHTGDNIHLGLLPFRVFDSTQSWVGSIWLEDILWIYLLGGLGVYYAAKKSRVWGVFGIIFYLSLLFVSHRDISRYALPLAPVVAMGIAEIWNRKEIRWATILILIPMFFYTLNYVQHNVIEIANWAPFL